MGCVHNSRPCIYYPILYNLQVRLYGGELELEMEMEMGKMRGHRGEGGSGQDAAATRG